MTIFFVQCIKKKLLDSVVVIFRKTKISVRVIRLCLFWIYQKPDPIIVYFTLLEFLDEVFNFSFPSPAPNKSNEGVSS